MEDRARVELLLDAIDWYSEAYQEVEDRPAFDLLRELGGPGVEAVANVLRRQVEATDELVACYCARLLIRARAPGRVGIIREVLRLPFRNRGVLFEVRETIYDHAVGDAEFLNDPAFIAESRSLADEWSNSQLDQFLRHV